MSNPNELAAQMNGLSLATHTPPYQQPSPAAAPNDLDQRLGALSLTANASTTNASPSAEQERRDAEYARALHAQELENAKAAAAATEASRRAAAERAEREKKAAQERKDRELAERLQRTEQALAAQPAARSPPSSPVSPVSPVSPHAVGSGASVLPRPPHYESFVAPPPSSRSAAQHAWHFRDNSNTERAYAVHQSKAIEAAYQLWLRQPADVQAAWDGVVLNHAGTSYAVDWKAWRQTRLTALGTPSLSKQCVRSIARHPLYVDAKPPASSFTPNFAASRQLQFDSANHSWQNYSAPMSKAVDRMSQLRSTHALHSLLPAMLVSTRSAHAHHNANRHVQSYAVLFDANRQQNLETGCVRSLRRVNLPGQW